jgi:2'-5' RNA ligase
MRTFVAIEVDDKGILQKIRSVQKSASFKASPVRIDQIHFTLQFLGEIDEELCEKVKDVLRTIAFSQFDLSLKGMGGFPNLKNPRVIWIGVNKKGAEKLIELAKEIEMKLTPLGFEKDKKFKPHLTVLRVKHKVGDISLQMKECEAIEFGTQVISKIKLKRSVLSPKGPEYSDLLVVNENEK